MKNNFLSKAYGGVTVARRKLNGLGLPQQWKVMTSTLLLLFTFSIGNVWAAYPETIWSSDMQETITGVTQTKGRSGDSWNTSLSLSWASGYTKGFVCGGSSSALTLDFNSDITVHENYVLRIYWGAANSKTLSLFINGASSANATQSPATNVLSVLEYEFTGDLTLDKFKIAVTGSTCYFFKAEIINLGPKPSTGETTISYEFTKGAITAKGSTNNRITTITGLSTTVALTGLSTSSSNSKNDCTGEITGQKVADDGSKYADLQFTIADGYTFTPSAASFKWRANSNSMQAKVVILDGTTTITSNESTSNGSTDNSDNISFESSKFTGDSVFTGTVHIRVYTYGIASKRAYLASPFTITGTVAAAVPVTNYTVTIDPNGGSYAETPDGWTYSAGVYTKEIASGTSFSVPAGLTKGTDGLTWKNGSDNDVTFPVSITGDITFVAQWAPHAASSNANLSALSVAGCTLNETFDPATTAYTIDLPFYGTMPAVGDVTATKDDANAAAPEVSISGNVITVHCVAENGTSIKDYTITVSIAAAPTASSSINVEQLVLDNSKKYDIGSALDAAHIGYVSKDALDSLKSVAEKADRNLPYLGLKFKTSTSKVTIIVPDGEYLKVKFGYIDGSAGLKVSVNGSAATAPSLTSGVYTLAASAGVKEVVFTQTGSNKTVVYKQIKINEDIDAVTLPWLVTYTVGEHGTCAKAKETWKGPALTLPAVTPESGWDFDGWFTAASAGTKVGGAGEEYTPTADVELFAQYTAQASPFDLTALTYKIGSAAAENVGYVDGKFTYNIELPYAPSYDAITVAPTLKESTSYLKGDEVLTVSSLPGAATFTVVAAGGSSEQLYTVNFTRDPKDGVSIIKAIADETNQDIKAENLTGLYKKAGHIYTSGSYKLDQKRYFMVQLEDGKNFQEGDVVEINVSSVNDCNGFTIYSDITGDDFADGNLIIDTHDETGAAAKVSAGINKITLPSYAGSNKLYVARKNGTEKYLNAGINKVEVKRAMNPVLTSITFAGVEATVNEAGKTVTVTVPNATNLGAMAVVPTIFRNAPHATTPEAVTTNGGEWAEGDNTYRIMDKDGDYTDYTVTITRAAVSHDATLSALTVDGNAIALEDGVYTYAYEYETGTAVSPAPVVAATAHDANAKSVAITQASDKKGTATVVVTAEDNSTTQTYTINFSISTKIKVVIFDGNDDKATAIKTSPHATGASWVVTGLSADDDDKGTSYSTKIATGGSTGASKNIAVTIPVNYQPFFELAQASNKNENERKAFITTTANGSGTKLYELANSVTNTPTKGMSEGLTEETTYYIHANASINFYEVNLYLLPLAPKAATPTLSGLADLAACTLGTDELTVTASDLDGGTAHYQWYKVVEGDDPDEAVGTDANTYAPTVVGNYYVVVTNQKEGYRDASKKSDEVTVSVKTHTEITVAPLNQRATVGNNATLSVTAIGDGILHYTWYTCDDELGTNPVAVDPANDAATYEVTVTAAMNQWYKVTVHSDCGEDQSATAKVSEFVPATPANVTASTTWDWKSTTAGFPTENTSINFENTSVEELFADVSASMPNNAEFRSDMLYGIGQRAWRKSDNDGECGFQGFQIRFHSEVAGLVRVYFRAPTSGQTSVVTINGRQAGSRGNSWGWSEYVDVEANTNVIIAMTNGETGMTRVQKIEFQTPGYVRTEMLGAGVYGTICVDHNVPEGGVRGVTVYKIAGREPQYGKIAFDEVTQMAAGVPYVFIAHGNEMALYYGETTVVNPVNGNGMYGTFVAQTLTELDGIYYFAKSALWSCVDLTSLNLPANRAYVKLSEIGYLDSSSPAPGRKRLLIGVNGAPAVATGFENVQGDQVQSTKVIIDGHLYILRGEKMYDAKGQLVK